jgi:hypothetical protein
MLQTEKLKEAGFKCDSAYMLHTIALVELEKARDKVTQREQEYKQACAVYEYLLEGNTNHG